MSSNTHYMLFLVGILFLVVFKNVDSYGGPKGYYSNEWLLKTEGGRKTANSLSENNGFQIIAEISGGYYVLRRTEIKPPTLQKDVSTLDVSTTLQIEYLHQMRYLNRTPKATVPGSMVFNDSYWSQMWHVQDDTFPSMGVYDAWRRSFSGKGVHISVLDDGVEPDHPDLVENYDSSRSYDYLMDGAYVNQTENDFHGTWCAGVASAVMNDECVVGMAYKSTFGAVKIFDAYYGLTDYGESLALAHELAQTDIYSNSWGPWDNGEIFEGPLELAKAALIQAMNEGRNGLGPIYTWAAGNGGIYDDCNCDGYANSIYTIAVTSIGRDQGPSWYSEECSNIMVGTYSGDSPDLAIATTDTGGGCTNVFQGTSASCPMAAGIIALVLEAKFPNVIGVIDGTQVQIKAPTIDEPMYVNRMGYHSLNTQIVFDHTDKIIDVVARWPGSTHDSRILRESGLWQVFEGQYLPAGEHYLLGDSGYPCKRWLLTPYLNPGTPSQQSYNRSHKSTRSKVERGIGQLKRRWGILNGEIRLSPEKACHPTLSWRDVQHLIVETSTRAGLIGANWQTNGAGYNVSHAFGFGIMNAAAMVDAAVNWENVPAQVVCESDTFVVNRSSNNGVYVVDQHVSNGCSESVQYLEHVEVAMTFQATYRGSVQITLISPSGTKSRLLRPRRFDTFDGTTEWTFMTVHNWGELASGTWKLQLETMDSTTVFGLDSWKLILYGTESATVNNPLAQVSKEPTSEENVNTGAIVGGVLGGVALLAVAALLVYLLVLKKPVKDPTVYPTMTDGPSHTNYQS